MSIPITSKQLGCVAAQDFSIGSDDVRLRPVVDTIITPERFGAVGDGIADDTIPVESAIAAVGRSGTIYGIPGHIYKVDASYSDLSGAKVDQSVRVTKDGKLLYYNPVLKSPIFNIETLHGWTKKITRRLPVKIMFCGDSTTSWGETQATYIPNLFKSMLISDGFDNVTVTDDAVGGVSTQTWINTYLPGEIAQLPDLWVIRLGLNDAKNWGTETALFRSALQTIRDTAGQALSDGVGIILMTPNAAYTSMNDEFTAEKFTDMLSRTALDLQCCFIDTGVLYHNAIDSPNLWMDDAMLHPRSCFNYLIAGTIYNVMLPTGVVKKAVPSGIIRTPRQYTPLITLPGYKGSTFYLSGGSLNAEINNSGYYSPEWITGTVSVNANRIVIGANSVLQYGIDDTVDVGPTGCLRFKASVNFSAAAGFVLFFIGGAPLNYPLSLTVPNTSWANAMYLTWFNNGGTALTQYSSDGVTAYPLQYFGGPGAIPFLDGVEYEWEFNWDWVSGLTTLHVNGVQIGATFSRKVTRTTGYHLSFGGGTSFATHTTIVNIRDVAIFQSRQHVPSSTFSIGSSIATTEISPNGIKLADSSEILSHYSTSPISVAATGYQSAQTFTGKLVRIGDHVSLTFPTLQALGDNTSIVIIGAVPAAYRPLADQRFSLAVLNNNVQAMGTVILTAATGTLTFYSDILLGNFTTGVSAGPFGTNIGWDIN